MSCRALSYCISIEVPSQPAKAQPTVRASNQNCARPIKRLVTLFNQTGSVQRSKVNIDDFIRVRTIE